MHKQKLRHAVEADLPHINDIFNHYVATSTCVWTSHHWSLRERSEWFKNHDPCLPIIVAESDGTIAGWGALSWFETACTFSQTVENSVYIHPDYLRLGLGKTILLELIHMAKMGGLVSIIASISSDQTVSIALHQSLGFVEAGQLKRVGHKFGDYRDLSYYQLLL